MYCFKCTQSTNIHFSCFLEFKYKGIVMMFEIDIECTDYCLQSVKPKKGDDCTICELFDFGTALQNIYPLLRTVFENLTYDDLMSAALVNDTWNKYANEEIRTRNKLSWIHLMKENKKEMIIEKSKNFGYERVSFGIIFYDYQQIKLLRHICIHGGYDVNKKTFAEYLGTEIVPNGVSFWALSCRGIYRVKNVQISDNSDEKVKEFKPVYSGLLLPTIPNINVRYFVFNKKTIEQNLPHNEHIYCMLLFTLTYPKKPVEKILNELSKRQDAVTVALGGGVVTGGIKQFGEKNSQRIYSALRMYCISFTRDNNTSADFAAYSMVITEENVYESKILELKSKVVMRENSFALRICCAAKCMKEIETPIFYKHFPKTCLIGLDVDGEIGWNNLTECDANEDDENAAKRSKILPKSCHQFSTIIVMITWGAKLE